MWNVQSSRPLFVMYYISVARYVCTVHSRKQYIFRWLCLYSVEWWEFHLVFQPRVVEMRLKYGFIFHEFFTFLQDKHNTDLIHMYYVGIRVMIRQFEMYSECHWLFLAAGALGILLDFSFHDCFYCIHDFWTKKNELPKK